MLMFSYMFPSNVMKALKSELFAKHGAFLRLCGRSPKDGEPLDRNPLRRNYEAQLKRLIEEEKYDDAYALYVDARRKFSELEEDVKLKYYDGLIKIYVNLRKYSEIREAQTLAEKYAAGNIQTLFPENR